MSKKYKIAFIGDERIHAAFTDMDPDWDFQIPISTIDEFYNEIQKEDSAIAEDTSIIILFSRLYDNDKESFAELVADLSAHALVCILQPEKDIMIKRNMIEEAIDRAKESFARNDVDYNKEARHCYISYEEPLPSIIEAIRKYVADPHGGAQAKNALRRILADIDGEEFGDLDDDFADEQEDEIFQEELDFSNRKKGKVIAVTSSKGGSGKSTVSITLGSYIAKASIAAQKQGLEENPLKVCVIDLDTRDGQLNFLTCNTPNPLSVIHIYSEYKTELTETAIKKGIYHSDKLDLDLIFALRKPRNADTIPPKFYKLLIEKLRGMYDYIILDTSVNYLDPLLEKVAYPSSDQIIFVTDMGISSITGMARWIKEVTTSIDDGGSGIDANRIGIVVNKAMPNVNMNGEMIENASKGRDILTMIPSNPMLVTYAANTCDLQRLLQIEQINLQVKRLAESIIGPSGYTLGDIPYNQIK